MTFSRGFLALVSCAALLTSCGKTPPASVSHAPNLTPLSSSSGIVQWNVGSVAEVYNPPGDLYTYAPSVVVDGNTEHIFTCHNRDSGVIKDYVFYTQRVGGVVVSSAPVLGASASGWDSVHACDPSVVRSNVSYNGTSYAWVMFYLGNDQNCSCRNQIGVALAQSIEGPWTKYPNPVITTPLNSSYWGVGQASVTSIDGNGRILVVHRQDDAGGYKQVRREVNLSNLNSLSVGAATPIPLGGLGVTGKAAADFINPDIVYDYTRDRFYMVGEQFPFQQTNPNYVGNVLHVFSISGPDFYSSSGVWHAEGSLDSALTGFLRNHNAGLKRSPYGNLPNSSQLSVIFAKSCADSSNLPCGGGSPLWTYDLWEATGAMDANSGAQTFYPFSEGGGSTTADSSGNGNAARLIGGAGFVAGKVGNGLGLGAGRWAGSNARLVDTASDFTVSGWVRLSSTGGYQTLASQDGNTVSGFYLQLDGASGRFALAVPSSDSTAATVSKVLASSAPSTGVWYHLAGVRSGNTLKLYVNGSLQGSQSAAGSWSAPYNAVVGRGKWDGNPVDYINGTVDEVRFYRRALSDSEISVLAQ